MIYIARIALLTLTLSGCASTLSGVGGTQSYACKAPVGALCTSVSGVYANALHGMAEVPRPPETAAAPILLGDTDRAGKVTSPFAGTKPLTSSISNPTNRPVPQSTSDPSFPSAPHADRPAPVSDPALRSEPRVLRLWIAPWEDSDGDLHDASVVHVVVDTGRWLIERVRPVPRNRLDRITPPAAMATPPQTPADSSPPAPRSPVSGDDTLPGSGVLPAEP